MVSPTATEERHYIGGSVLVTITGRTASVAGTTKTRYLHKDHLGSITAITDEGGAEVEAFSFDPWGKRRAPTLASLIAKIGSPWTSMSTYQKSNLTLVASALSSTLTNKGFTGHEQLDGVELIHMGGRVYDAEIGRFLSADPFVQDITNLQGLNRYSYVENNPLSYTDPSGFFLKKLFNKVGDALGDALSSIGRAVKKALVKVLRGNLIDTIKIVARYYVCSSIEDSSACAQIVDGVVDVVANSANGGTRDKHDSTSSTGNIQARHESSPWWSRGNRNASSRYILQIQNDSMGGPINDATRPKSPAEAFVDVGHAVAEAKVADGASTSDMARAEINNAIVKGVLNPRNAFGDVPTAAKYFLGVVDEISRRHRVEIGAIINHRGDNVYVDLSTIVIGNEIEIHGIGKPPSTVAGVHTHVPGHGAVFSTPDAEWVYAGRPTPLYVSYEGEVRVCTPERITCNLSRIRQLHRFNRPQDQRYAIGDPVP